MKNDNTQKTPKEYKGKLTLAEFRAEQFIESTVNEKMQNYSDEDIKNQIDILVRIIDKIKLDKSKKKSLKDIEKEIYYFLKEIFNQIEQPTANDFFRLRTFEYIVKNKIDVEARVKAILESRVNVLEIKDNLDINNQVYSGNIEKNIDTFLCELISELPDYEYSISERFNNMIKKISNNELKPSDAPLLAEYLKGIMESISIGRGDDCERILKNNIEELYSRLINNLDKFFKVDESTQIFDTSSLNKNLMQQPEKQLSLEEITELAQKNEGLKIPIKRDTTKSSRHVTVKKCISNPFIGKDKNNNMDIHIYTLLKHYSTEQEFIDYFYSAALQSRKNPEYKKYILGLFRKDLKYDYSSMHVTFLLSKRIIHLMDLYKMSNKLDEYNSLNNRRLRDKSLQRITIETEELEQILRNLNNSNLVSSEAIIAISAFYVNRLAKIWPIFARIKFILDKKDIIKKVYENPDLKYEDFEFSEDEIKLYMAQYDTLQQILEDGYVSKLTDLEIYKIESDNQTREKARKLYSAALSEHAVKYQKLYGTFEQDSKNVSINCEVARKFYIIKHDSIKSLIYTALTDKDHNIINWGYVPCDENNQKNRVLIGFDIKYLNMPVFFHVKESELKRLVKEATGDTKIPVYEGDIDTHYFFGKQRITTLVLYPVTKNIRKNLKVNPKDKVKTLLKHLIWLQKPKERPEFISEPGSRLYDLSTKEIIKKRKNKPDQDDPEL